MGLKLKLKIGGSGIPSSSEKKTSNGLPSSASADQRSSGSIPPRETPASSNDAASAPQAKRPRVKVSLGKAKDVSSSTHVSGVPEPASKRQKLAAQAKAIAPQLQSQAYQFPSAESVAFPPLQPASSVASFGTSEGNDSRKLGRKIKIKSSKNGTTGTMPAFASPTQPSARPVLKREDVPIASNSLPSARKAPQRTQRSSPWQGSAPDPNSALHFQHDLPGLPTRGVLQNTHGLHGPIEQPPHAGLPHVHPSSSLLPRQTDLPPLAASTLPARNGVPETSRPPLNLHINARLNQATNATAPKKAKVSIKFKRKSDIVASGQKPVSQLGKVTALPATANEHVRLPLHEASAKANAVHKGPRIKLKRSALPDGAVRKPALTAAPAAKGSVASKAIASAQQRQGSDTAAARALRALGALPKHSKGNALQAPAAAPAAATVMAEPPVASKVTHPKAKRTTLKVAREAVQPQAPTVKSEKAPAEAAPVAEDDAKEVEDRDKDKPPVPTKLLRKLFNALVKDDKKTGWFQTPVTEELAPGYFNFIKEPMDYSTMKTKLKIYRTFGEMQRDVRLMFRNATTFNPAGSVVHNKALELLSKSEEKFKEARTAWLNEVPQGGGGPTLSAAPSASAADSAGAKGRDGTEVMSRARREIAASSAPILAPRRAMNDMYVAPRPRGRPARKSNVNVSRVGVHRVHTSGMQRTMTLNARVSYLPRPHVKHALWGSLVNGASAEGSIQWASERAKIAHAYQKREIDLETCARKLAFFGRNLRGSARSELMRRASMTILRRRIVEPPMPTPAAAAPAAQPRATPAGSTAQAVAAAPRQAYSATHADSANAAASATPVVSAGNQSVHVQQSAPMAAQQSNISNQTSDYGARQATHTAQAASNATANWMKPAAAPAVSLQSYSATPMRSAVAAPNTYTALGQRYVAPPIGSQAVPASAVQRQSISPSTPLRTSHAGAYGSDHGSQGYSRSAPDSPDVIDLRGPASDEAGPVSTAAQHAHGLHVHAQKAAVQTSQPTSTVVNGNA